MGSNLPVQNEILTSGPFSLKWGSRECTPHQGRRARDRWPSPVRESHSEEGRGWVDSNPKNAGLCLVKGLAIWDQKFICLCIHPFDMYRLCLCWHHVQYGMRSCLRMPSVLGSNCELNLHSERDVTSWFWSGTKLKNSCSARRWWRCTWEAEADVELLKLEV